MLRGFGRKGLHEFFHPEHFGEFSQTPGVRDLLPTFSFSWGSHPSLREFVNLGAQDILEADERRIPGMQAAQMLHDHILTLDGGLVMPCGSAADVAFQVWIHNIASRILDKR
jgi:hypothetical protein